MDTDLSAEAFFSAKLRFETDPADLVTARSSGRPPVVVDVRSHEAWAQGHIPGAVHVPTAELPARAAEVIDSVDAEVVVYCWGPGCNGSTRAALELTRLGYGRVRELIGGFEYWAREGLAVISSDGPSRRAVDGLVAPLRSS